MEISPAQTIKVEIFNQTYNLRGDGEHRHIEELAAYVDSQMREVASTTMTVDSLRVAILAALNIADELHRAKKELEKMDGKIAEMSNRYSNMIDQSLKRISETDGDELEY